MPHALVIIPNNFTESAPLIEIIERSGYTVSVANTLYAARQITGRLAPSIIFAEVNLPDGNSFELLKASPWPKSSAIILLAASPTAEGALEAIRAGAKDYLASPIDYHYLKDLLLSLKP